MIVKYSLEEKITYRLDYRLVNWQDFLRMLLLIPIIYPRQSIICPIFIIFFF